MNRCGLWSDMMMKQIMKVLNSVGGVTYGRGVFLIAFLIDGFLACPLPPCLRGKCKILIRAHNLHQSTFPNEKKNSEIHCKKFEVLLRQHLPTSSVLTRIWLSRIRCYEAISF
ncbi:hypothetical protein AVEN_104450-1 [Araneus ventricosus]|uniref:Uncharacterized protein n=1 Tax=Araneus ventricosus TaxID=182803 RepID=A0A4Y2MU15_ARAVE|nr:hypothetical protein AVEN_104450-1 [Araneus ventricosus]